MKVYYNEFDKKKCAALQALMDDGHIRKGDMDERHLYPDWHRVIPFDEDICIFGEQVAPAFTNGWFDGVHKRMEMEGYTARGAVLPACSVGAPQKRYRLWFVADCESADSEREWTEQNGKQDGFTDDGAVAHNKCERPQGQGQLQRPLCSEKSAEGKADQLIYDSARNWENGVWIDCPDGKQRLVKPGIPLLANGYPERVGVIHCAGDAIVPQLAAEFIGAFMECKERN